MTINQFFLPYRPAYDAAGISVPGAKLYFTEAGGTNTPLAIYEDEALTIELSNPVVADGAGQFVPIYLQAADYRVRIYGRTAEVGVDTPYEEYDPYIPGALVGTVLGNESSVVPSRAQLAALTGAANSAVHLAEAGREGLFYWDANDLSAQVTADTAQGVYVAPGAAPTGASGAWVRQFSGPLNIGWFGAVADCTAIGVGTNAAPAINAAMAVAALDNKSAEVLVPSNILGYRVSSLITFTTGVKLRGQGWHENPGQVGATTYPAPQNWRGSILVFDQNIAGLQFIGFTDNLANATAFEYEGASFSVVEDLALYGGGGTTVTAHGIETRVAIQLRNVRVENFAGNGVKVIAYTAGANPWGNANSAKFDHVLSRGNKCHGWYIEGIDTNVISFINCDGSLNGGVGFLDKSLIGNNSYVGCHAATNNQSYGTATAARTQVVADWAGLSDANAGSFVTVHAGGQSNLYLSCYVEVGNGMKGEITAPGIVIGGVLAESGSRTATWNANTWGGSSITGLSVAAIKSFAGLTIGHAAGAQVDVFNMAGGTAALRLLPGTGTYANLQLRGNTDSLANGMDILAGGAAGYFSADGFTFRNAAQATTWLTVDNNGYNIQNIALKIGGTTVVDTSRNITGVAGAFSGSLKSSSATGGIGYATGAGGAVTQLTSKSTAAPTLDKACGEVTMNNASLGAATIVSFTMPCAASAANDNVTVSHVSGGTLGAYTVSCAASAGTLTFYVRNNTAGALGEALVLRYSIIKGVVA